MHVYMYIYTYTCSTSIQQPWPSKCINQITLNAQYITPYLRLSRRNHRRR